MHKLFSTFLSFFVFCLFLYMGQAQALNAIFLTEPTKTITHKPSAMVVSRDENRTVITLAPDFSYDGSQLGLLIPLPKIVTDTQLRFADVGQLDAVMSFTAPRYNVYKDDDVCAGAVRALEKRLDEKKSSILSYTQKYAEKPEVRLIKREELIETPIQNILKDAGFVVDKAYEDALLAYKNANVDFALLIYAEKLDDSLSMSPVQVAYESDNFILPLGLSTLNGGPAQDLTIVFISRDGLVQPKAAGLKKMPSGVDLPLFVKNDFAQVYADIFAQSVTTDNFQSLFLEFSGDLGWCPNCKDADTLTRADLRGLGAWWVDKAKTQKSKAAPESTPDNIYFTRMHIRHTNKTLLNNVEFVNAKDKNRFQTVFNLHQPYIKDAVCEDGRLYQANLPRIYDVQLNNLVALTGYEAVDIRARMTEGGQNFDLQSDEDAAQWWERMWDIPTE